LYIKLIKCSVTKYYAAILSRVLTVSGEIALKRLKYIYKGLKGP
jgi:hypothetical protein